MGIQNLIGFERRTKPISDNSNVNLYECEYVV